MSVNRSLTSTAVRAAGPLLTEGLDEATVDIRRRVAAIRSPEQEPVADLATGPSSSRPKASRSIGPTRSVAEQLVTIGPTRRDDAPPKRPGLLLMSC
jgi:hypothetical protein